MSLHHKYYKKEATVIIQFSTPSILLKKQQKNEKWKKKAKKIRDGGGSPGLMGGVSIAVFLGGSQVLGIVPKALAQGDIIGKTIGEEL